MKGRSSRLPLPSQPELPSVPLKRFNRRGSKVKVPKRNSSPTTKSRSKGTHYRNDLAEKETHKNFLDTKPTYVFSGPRSGSEYKPPILNRKSVVSNRYFKFRLSTGWVADTPQRVEEYSIPFIDLDGELTHLTLGKISLTPSQLFASILTTCYSRTRTWLQRSYHRSIKNRSDLIFRACLIYVITGNTNFFRRFKCMFRKRINTCSLIYKYFSQLDEVNRFYYDQAYKDATWFQYRKSILDFTRLSSPRTLFFDSRNTITYLSSKKKNKKKIVLFSDWGFNHRIEYRKKFTCDGFHALNGGGSSIFSRIQFIS